MSSASTTAPRNRLHLTHSGLRLAAEKVLAERRVLWPIVGLVAAARAMAELSVLWPIGADASQYVVAGRQAIDDPSHVYVNAARQIAAGFTWTATWPPPQVLISMPYALLPGQVGIWAWTLTNGLFVGAALVLLSRAVGATRGWALPLYVLVCLCFTPLFEELRLGQRSGLVLLTGVGAMLTAESRPLLAGGLAGLGTSLKFYPAALLLSVRPTRLVRFGAALVGVATGVLLLTFIPFGNPITYFTDVLFPVAAGASSATHDCFQNSTPLLFSRLIGGQSFSVINSSGVWREVSVGGWHLPWLATLLSYGTRALLVAGTIWASRRCGWSQPLSMAMAFSLGALIPGDVYTYQFICMLPLASVVAIRSVERRHWILLGIVAVSLWIFISSPCALVFPGLWTIAGIGLFVAGLVSAARSEPADLRGSSQAG